MIKGSQFIALAWALGSVALAEGWIIQAPKSTAATRRISQLFQSSRFDELVGLDAGTETPSPVDERYYSVPPTQPQLMANTKPRITLTRFLSNAVKEDPNVRKSS